MVRRSTLRRTLISAAVALLLGALTASAQGTLIVLKTATPYPLPYPVNGIVTLTLASSAYIKVQAGDVDYNRTAAYTNRAIVRATTATVMVDPHTGRKYWNLTFGTHFVASAWADDVDTAEMNAGLPIFTRYHAAQPGLTFANYQRLRQGMTFSAVVGILGGGADLKASSQVGDHSSEVYEWSEGSAIVTIVFSDGALSVMSEYGLK